MFWKFRNIRSFVLNEETLRGWGFVDGTGSANNRRALSTAQRFTLGEEVKKGIAVRTLNQKLISLGALLGRSETRCSVCGLVGALRTAYVGSASFPSTVIISGRTLYSILLLALSSAGFSAVQPSLVEHEASSLKFRQSPG